MTRHPLLARDSLTCFASRQEQLIGLPGCSGVLDFRLVLVEEAVVLLLVEEVSVADVLVGVVTSEGLWGHLLVRVAEVDVPHVVRIVQQIGVQSIVVPEVVLVVLALPMSMDHVVEEPRHSGEDVRPEDGAQHVEPRVTWAHDFVVGVSREALVGSHVGERLLEGDNAMLHEGERAHPENGDTGASVGSPLSVEVHLDGLVEDGVATLDGVSLDTLSEVTDLLRVHHELVSGLPRIRLIERKEALW